tara:strand:+ start:712 stop:906 length:195 start_codon:yes stop_codon:yes gene_type:complete
MLLQRLQLEYRLKELELTKQRLAKKINVTPMTLQNKFKNPESFKLSELKSMVKCGFLKSLIIDL